MHATILAAFFEFPLIVIAMCAAGTALLVIGAWAARSEIAAAKGLDKIVALANMCFAAPFAVFAMLHLFAPQFIEPLVPRYMPWRMFWVYFIGIALVAAALSIATKIAVRWSGLLLGIMMFSFVAMLYLPGELARPNRITFTIVFRESSFGAAAWVLAANAKNGWRAPTRTVLITVGRIVIAAAAIVFGVQHFLHPTGLPVVPLERQMATWIPGRVLIDYVTGAALVVAGIFFLLGRKARLAGTYLGTWILFLVVVMYGPVMIAALTEPGIGAKVEGINYFYDTLLFGGVILALASAMPAGADRKKETSAGAAISGH